MLLHLAFTGKSTTANVLNDMNSVHRNSYFNFAWQRVTKDEVEVNGFGQTLFPIIVKREAHEIFHIIQNSAWISCNCFAQSEY